MRFMLVVAGMVSLLGMDCLASVLVLAKDGKTDYEIVVAAEATGTDRFAANELATFLKESTGAVFPVVGQAKGVRTIEVGTARARAIVSVAFPRKFKVETSAVVSDGDTVAIWGEGPTGNAYGVYQFLEQVVGCRWLTTLGDNLVPKHPTLTASPLKLIERPKLDYRMLLTFGGANDANSNDHLFLFRNRINQVSGNYENVVRPDLKGVLPVRLRENIPNCHSFFRYMPPKTYFKDHPEYYSLWKGNERSARQLCLSNPELRKELTKNFLAHAEKVGGKGFLDLSQEDTDDEMCLCDGCRALSKKYESNGGPLFDYLIELAPVAKTRFPDLIIHTLVYHRDSTQKPPKVDSPFPDNVAVVFAPLDDDFSKSLDHPNNRVSFGHLRRWCELCKVWTWSYPLPYTGGLPPFGGLGRSADDMRLGIEAGLTGSYHEHDVGTGCGANFADLQTWLLTQHFRDPARDWRSLRKEFCDALYGAASADVIAYEEYLEQGRVASKVYVGFLGRVDAFITPAEAVAWERRFDEMERKVGGDPKIVQRLREVRIGLDNLMLIQWRQYAAATKIPFSAESVHDRLVATYEAAFARRYNYNHPAVIDVRKSRTEKARKEADMKLFLVNAKVKPLPKEFDAIPDEKIVQIFPEGCYIGEKQVEMEDAAAGIAHYEPGAKVSLPYSCGLYDRTNDRFVLNSPIKKADIVPNAFHIYKIGRGPVPSGECLVWMGSSWRMSRMCQQVFRPGMDEDWDVYVSLKFTGPAYDPACMEGENAVYYDRIIFVGPFAK